MAQVSRYRVAVLATDGFEESELTEPVKTLRDAGAQVDIISTHSGQIQAFKYHDKSITVPVDRTLDRVSADEYDAVMLPGGALNADHMRIVPEVQRFLQAMDKAGKPIAMICHAPWELVSAGLVRGRTLTSWPTLQDDIRNAGGTWVDRDVVIDRNVVTSRKLDDLPAFNREMLKLFGSQRPQPTMR